MSSVPGGSEDRKRSVWHIPVDTIRIFNSVWRSGLANFTDLNLQLGPPASDGVRAMMAGLSILMACLTFVQALSDSSVIGISVTENVWSLHKRHLSKWLY
jgi:hypothetical protein